ncbi:teichoic acid D-Ala incorporation-associated protein DltX [Oenococcus alcoholitolerans]
MKTVEKFFQNPVTSFVLRTIFYFVVLLILLYLYGYTGINDGGFIYNGF